MKVDHRTYTRAQLDFIVMQAVKDAKKETITNSIKFYNCAAIMSLMGSGMDTDKILEFVKDATALFESMASDVITYEDCLADIKRNSGIDLEVIT